MTERRKEKFGYELKFKYPFEINKRYKVLKDFKAEGIEESLAARWLDVYDSDPEPNFEEYFEEVMDGERED